MQERVNLRELERSKFLRKPLNVQTGEEDGHQGGQRFEAEDAGYQVIRGWVLKQAELQRGEGGWRSARRRYAASVGTLSSSGHPTRFSHQVARRSA